MLKWGLNSMKSLCGADINGARKSCAVIAIYGSELEAWDAVWSN